MVEINSIAFKPEFRTETTDFLLGGVLDKIVVEIDCTAYWATGNDPNGLSFVTDGGATGHIISLGPANFINDGFLVGDSVLVSGTVSNNLAYTITAFANNGMTMYVSGNTVINESGVASAVITGKTICTGLNLRFNLLENAAAESYLSLVDNNELKFSATVDYTNVVYIPMVQQGVKNSNKLGSARVKGTGTLNRFIIEHTFYIVPPFTTDELANFEDGIAPPYFFDYNCLRYIYNVEMLYLLNDPNKVHRSDVSNFKIGNTGWFNENFNQGLNKFTQQPPVYTVGGLPVAYADYQQVTNFSITINSVNGIFSAGNTKLAITHFILPENDADFQDTITTFTQNFAFDRALLTEGAGAINGDNFGGTVQVLKNLVFTRVSNSMATVTGQIDLSSANKALISAMTDRKFVLACTTQNHTLATAVADRETLMAGPDYYDTNLANPSLGDVYTDFFYHPDVVNSASDAGMFIEDAVIGRSKFFVDITNSPEIISAQVVIKAVNGSDSFELERKAFSFAGAIVQNGVQQINVIQSRGFKLKAGDPFNVVSLTRDAASDTGMQYYYELLYAFKIRWEDFIQLANVDPAFYDVAEDFNGFNNNWARYFAGAGWTLQYDVTVYVEENGYVNTLSSSSTLNAYNYDDATDWSPAVITIKDSNNVDTNGSILSNDVMTVTAEFTKLSGGNPAIGNIAGIIEIEPYEAGGINIIRQTSTVRQFESDSPFVSTLPGDLCAKSVLVNVYTFTTLLDGSKLGNNAQYKISARIYDLTNPPLSSGKKFQSGDDFVFQDGSQYKFQDQ